MAGNRRTRRGAGYDAGPPRNQMRYLLRDFRKSLRQGLAALAETMEPVLKPLFAINQASAMIRSLIFAAAFLLWVGFAFITRPPDFGSIAIPPAAPGDNVALMLNSLRLLFGIFMAIVNMMFNPAVFRFVLVIAFAFWLASRVAAIYLADIFDLPSIDAAIKFIRQAAFVTMDPRRMNRLIIREGQVLKGFQNSSIYQIGGPGLVQVNLENVAVFEKVDGTPHIIPPTGRPVPIEGFERLRKIIDLRDQFIENAEVVGRTKDGIPVRAKGIRFSFSIQRDHNSPRNLDFWDEQAMPQPLNYSDNAVLNLVYGKPNEPFDEVGSAEVRAAIRRFISENSLSQFLADSRDEESRPSNLPSDPTMPLKPGDTGFKAREIINQELIASFRTQAEATIDLHWVSVGTWVPPAVIPEKHKEAWRRRAKSEAESHPKALLNLVRSTRLKEILRLIQDVPINAFGHIASREDDPERIKRELMLAYREKIKIAREIYLANELEVPVQLEAALRHLERL